MGQWLTGFESPLVPDLPLFFILTLIGLRAFDLVSSPVWWEAVTNNAFWFVNISDFYNTIFLFSSAVYAFVLELVTSQTLFKPVQVVLIPMQLPAAKARFSGQNTFFFLGLPDLVGDWFFFFAYFLYEIHRFPRCLSSLGEY